MRQILSASKSFKKIKFVVDENVLEIIDSIIYFAQYQQSFPTQPTYICNIFVTIEDVFRNYVL